MLVEIVATAHVNENFVLDLAAFTIRPERTLEPGRGPGPACKWRPVREWLASGAAMEFDLFKNSEQYVAFHRAEIEATCHLGRHLPFYCRLGSSRS